MKKYILNSLLLLITWTVQAHQPDMSSTILAEKKDKTWIIQVKSALTGFDYAVKAAYPNKPEPYNSPEEFQAMAIKLLKENIQIEFNGEKKATLKNGSIQLGHETVAVFEVVGVPTDIVSFSIKNSSFQEIKHNQNKLFVLKNGFKKTRHILNNENYHTVHLKAKDGQFILNDPMILPSDVGADYSKSGITFSLFMIFLITLLYGHFTK